MMVVAERGCPRVASIPLLGDVYFLSYVNGLRIAPEFRFFSPIFIDIVTALTYHMILLL